MTLSLKDVYLILRFFYVFLFDAAAVNPKGIKTLLANGLILFLEMGQKVYQEILLNV